MKTVSDLIAHRGAELLSLLEVLLRDHSSLYQWNRPDSAIFSTSGNHAFRDLDPPGKQLQSRLLEEYLEFADLVGVLLRAQPDKARKNHDKNRKTVLAAITQEGSTWHRTIDEELAFATEALQAQIELITHLYSDADEGVLVVVPDTNALLWHPDLDDWSFEEAQSFEVCLVPVVLSELDGLKMNHRNAEVRDKAEGLIRRIKGYRDRGSLRQGVALRKGVSRIRSVAVEPDFGASLHGSTLRMRMIVW